MSPVHVYLALVAAFNVSEFLLTWLINPAELSWRSWLVSREYVAALAAGLLEHAVRTRCLASHGPWPPWAQHAPLALGLALACAGEAVRKAAMITAGPAFTHLIKRERRREHALVTRGPYAWLRHPGYTGWYLWALGTQVLLGNAVCTLAFATVASRFFAARCNAEERYLLAMFGCEYEAYAARTPILIPGVSGAVRYRGRRTAAGA